MIAKDRRRSIERTLIALVAAGAFGTLPVWAQQPGRTSRSTPASSQPAQGKTTALDAVNAPTPVLKAVTVPVNPTDPIAIVNKEAITRQQLANECIARKGQEILETLIARTLVEQAMKAKHVEVTAAEIDAEIDRVAQTVAGLGREAWLRSLDKERGISPIQYARDIIYPALAMRKLAAPRVKVSEQDLKDAYEAQFGDKLRCRIIMVDKLRAGQEVWEELKKNPAAFEKIAQERSIDMTSRSLGGLLGEPITRHAYPREVSDKAFQQLVDGDPKDQDPNHKPKDGDFSAVIQVTEASWVIIRREGIISGDPKVSFKDPAVRAMLNEMMFEAKVKAEVGEVYQELFTAAAIENLLTGSTKTANEVVGPHPSLETPKNRDGNVTLSSNPDGSKPSPNAAAPGTQATATKSSGTPPVGLDAGTKKRADELKRQLKPKADPATPPASAGAQPNN